MKNLKITKKLKAFLLASTFILCGAHKTNEYEETYINGIRVYEIGTTKKQVKIGEEEIQIPVCKKIKCDITADYKDVYVQDSDNPFLLKRKGVVTKEFHETYETLYTTKKKDIYKEEIVPNYIPAQYVDETIKKYTK